MQNLGTCHPNWIEQDEVEAKVNKDHDSGFHEHTLTSDSVLLHIPVPNVPISKDIRPER